MNIVLMMINSLEYMNLLSTIEHRLYGIGRQISSNNRLGRNKFKINKNS